MTTRRLLVPAAGAVLALTVLAAVVRVGRKGPGVRRRETTGELPGDDLFPGAGLQSDHARTIAAPPERVWPWIAQLGQDKAGFYSFEILENLVGCEIAGGKRIHPEWQHPGAGDVFRLHPELALRVTSVQPDAYLVVSSLGGEAPGEPGSMGFDISWSFVLTRSIDRRGQPATRLHLRERYLPYTRFASVQLRVVRLVSTVMSWRMLATIDRLACGGARAS